MPEQTAIPLDASPIPLDERGFIASIDLAALETQPCDHISLRDLFPPAFCRQLLDSVPPAQHFHQLRHRDATQPDGRSARLRLYFYPEQLWVPAGCAAHPQDAVPARQWLCVFGPEVRELAQRRDDDPSR